MTQDELTLTEDDKKSGFTSIKRDGRFKSGLRIEFNIKGITFTLPIRPRDRVESIFVRYKKRLMDQSLPIKVNEFSDVCSAIENTIMRHFDWVIGEDIRHQKEGYTTINSDSTTIVDTTFEDKTDDNDFSTYVKVSISEAIGKHLGKIQFEGVIASAATDKMQFLKKAIWRCYACKEYTTREVFNILDIPNNPTECRSCETRAGFAHCHEYINSRLLKIQSEDNTNDTALELLPVYVLNQYTDNIQLSGRVKIYGRIAKRQDSVSKQFYTVVIANHVEYKDKKRLELTRKDTSEIHKFSKRKDLEFALVDQFARNIIGERFSKLTVILSAIGAPERIHPTTDRVVRRGRMHILMIGPPGTGKTAIAKEGGDLRPNSKYVSGTNTTGGSLTSMVLSEDGKLTLRLGVAATTRGAFLIINEFDKLSDEHKNAILEVMEEGESILNKYTFLRKINAQTSVIATANPVNGDWINSLVISDKELPFPLQLLSRFDSILVFRRTKNKKACEEFAEACSNLTNIDLESHYDFLQKYIEFARQVQNVTVNSDAKKLLNSYFAELVSNDSIEYDVSNRTFMTIYRCAETFARLHLRKIITKSIAQRAIDHINEMLSKLNLSPSSKLDPSIYAFDKVVEYLQIHTHNRSDAKNLVTEVIQPLCLHDEIIHNLLGDVFNRRGNNKLDTLCDKILKIRKAKLGIVGVRPTIIYWKHPTNCDCDQCSERLKGECDQCVTQNPLSEESNKKFDTSYIDKYVEAERKNKKINKKIRDSLEARK